MVTSNISRSTKIILIVEFILLAYMLYVLSTSLYKGYQVDRFISKAQEENVLLEKANSSLAEDFEYYSSEAYKEKIAKQNLGLIRPGEEVIILTHSGVTTGTEIAGSTPSENYYNSFSNPKKWFFFFFERDRFAL